MAHPVRCLLKTSIAAVLVICSLPTADSSDDIGWGFTRDTNNKYYFNTTLKATWQKATEICRQRDMLLVSIQDEGKFNEVKEVINESGYFENNAFLHMWTSLNDIGEEGQYVWASNGTPNKLNIFRAGEPNNSEAQDDCDGEDCVALVHHRDLSVTYGLDDRACSNEFVFICEHE